MRYKIPFIKPGFPSVEDIAEDYSKILQSNWFTNFGPFEREFSQKISSYIGDGFTAVTSSSATSALMASVLGVLGKGDDTKYVLMPSFTFAAVADAIVWCGYKPLFIDIENHGLHMDINIAKTALNDTKYKAGIVGILFCNSFGIGSTDIQSWETLADEAGLPLIIDSAAGFGSLYSKDRKLGSAGTCEIFSFHATKPFAIGEGGAVVTRNEKLARSIKAIQNFGFDDSKSADSLGFNGKLEELNAAIGLRQFARLEQILGSRKKVFEAYNKALDPGRYSIQSNAELGSLCFLTVIVKDYKHRDDLVSSLNDAGVEAKTYYSPAVHEQGYFKKYEAYRPLKVTDAIGESVISLPVHENMDPKDIELIIEVLNG